MTDSTEKLPFFAATCYCLSLLEFVVPRPAFFLHYGFANLPLLVALDCLSMREFLVLAFAKLVGQSILSGTTFSFVFAFSFFSTFSAAFSMLILQNFLHRGAISRLGISVASSFFANCAQILLAEKMFDISAVLIAAPLFLFGLFTSAIFGLCAERFIQKSRVLAALSEGRLHYVPPSDQHLPPCKKNFIFAAFSFALLIVICVSQSVLALSAEFAVATILLLARRKKPNFRAFFSFAAVLFAFSLAAPPFGRIFFSIGTLRVTSGPILSTLRRVLKFEGTIFASRAIFSDFSLLRSFVPKTVLKSVEIFSDISRRCNFFAAKSGFSFSNIFHGKILQALDVAIEIFDENFLQNDADFDKKNCGDSENFCKKM